MSGEDLKFAFVAFTAVFFVVDPFVAVPVFLAITADDPAEKRRRMALRAAFAAERFLSKTTLHVLQRVMGLLLAAVAVEFVVGGIRDLWPTM